MQRMNMAPGEIDSLGLPVLGPNFWALFVLFLQVNQIVKYFTLQILGKLSLSSISPKKSSHPLRFLSKKPSHLRYPLPPISGSKVQGTTGQLQLPPAPPNAGKTRKFSQIVVSVICPLPSIKAVGGNLYGGACTWNGMPLPSNNYIELNSLLVHDLELSRNPILKGQRKPKPKPKSKKQVRRCRPVHLPNPPSLSFLSLSPLLLLLPLHLTVFGKSNVPEHTVLKLNV
nr:hypothetical protein CFP56_31070 [Quercus suber]